MFLKTLDTDYSIYFSRHDISWYGILPHDLRHDTLWHDMSQGDISYMFFQFFQYCVALVFLLL